MATPGEIRDETLKALRAAQKRLNSSAWILHLEGQPPGVQTEAAECQLRIQQARVALENAQLKDIRDGLLANEKEFEAGRVSLERALKQLTKVRDVLDSAGKLVAAVTKAITAAP